MQHTRQYFFTGSRRAFNQNGDIGFGNALSQGQLIAAGRVDIHHAARGSGAFGRRLFKG